MTIENYITISLHPKYFKYFVELHFSTEEIVENPSTRILLENHSPQKKESLFKMLQQWVEEIKKMNIDI